MEEKIPVVFLDTNILHNSSLIGTRSFEVESTMPWGHNRVTTKLRRTQEYHRYEKFKAKRKAKNEPTHQERDALSLPFLAYDGICGNVRFVVHPEVKLELMGLPGNSGRFGWFYGCKVETDTSGAFDYSRVWLGGGKTKKDHLQAFIGSIKHKRFLHLNKKLGGYQGNDRPYNHNQALDALYLWMAEEIGADYFLTMDRNFLRQITYQKVESPVMCTHPSALLWTTVKRKGFWQGTKFLVGGYKFAKERFS